MVSAGIVTVRFTVYDTPDAIVANWLGLASRTSCNEGVNESEALLMGAVLVKVTVVVKIVPAAIVRSTALGDQTILAGCCAKAIDGAKANEPIRRISAKTVRGK